MHGPKIKIFWDLESCPPPHSYDGSPWDLLKAIRLFAVRFGIVNSFKAYWDLGRCLTAGTESLKTVMPSMGISLVDCSLVKEYDRDALSRTLAVEVLASAIDDPVDLRGAEPGIIMIFSGDATILHPISLLMLRGYTVFLVVPEQSNYLASSRVTRIFDWNTDILNLTQQRNPTLVPMLGMGQSSQPGPSVTSQKTSGIRRPSDVSNHSTSISLSTVNTDFTSPTSPPKPQVAIQKLLLPHTPEIAAQILPDFFQATINTTVTSKTKPTGISKPPVSSVIGQNSMNQLLSPSSQPKRDVVGSSKHLGGPEQPEPRASQQLETLPTDDCAVNSGGSEGGEWETSRSSWSVESVKRQSQQEAPGRSGLPMTELKLSPPQVEMPLPESSPTDNAVFLPLLQGLQKARAEGKDQLLRSAIGMMLSKDVYRTAGVSNLGGYIMLAAQKGLVNFGGTSGREWVSLNGN